MKIPKCANDDKFIIVLLYCLLLICFVLFLFSGSYGIVLAIITAVLLVILLPYTIFSFGNYEITKENIIFHCLMYKKVYHWSDFKFIGKLQVRRDKGFLGKKVYDDIVIFSLNLEKEKINRPCTMLNFSKNFFKLPYSAELEKTVLLNSPTGCFVGYLTDDKGNILTI